MRTIKQAFAATAVTALVAGGAVAVTAAPAHAIYNRTLVTRTSIVDSNNKSITAECPAGKKVIGAGGKIIDSFGKVHLTDVVPSLDLRSVRVEGGEQVAFGGSTSHNWSVQAQAMCAPETEFAELRRVEATGITVVNPASSHPAKLAILACPYYLKVFGTGYELSGANGDVVLQQLEPSSSLQIVQARVKPTETGLPAYTFTLYGICGTPRTTMERVEALTPHDSNQTHGAVTNACDPGLTLAGMGAMIEDENPFTLFDRLELSITTNQVTTNAWENQPGNFISDWNVKAWAVCVS